MHNLAKKKTKLLISKQRQPFKTKLWTENRTLGMKTSRSGRLGNIRWNVSIAFFHAFFNSNTTRRLPAQTSGQPTSFTNCKLRKHKSGRFVIIQGISLEQLRRESRNNLLHKLSGAFQPPLSPLYTHCRHIKCLDCIIEPFLWARKQILRTVYSGIP